MKKAVIIGMWIWLCAMTAMAGSDIVRSSLAHRRYTTQDGLSQMQAERLWQDSKGYIYIGTLSGFVRFDGSTFTPFLKGRRLNIVGFAEVEPGDVRALGFFRQWTVSYDDAAPLPLDPQGHWLLNNLNAGSLPNGYVLLEDSLEQNRRLCRMNRQGMQVLLKAELLDKMTPDRRLWYDAATGKALVPLADGVYQTSAEAEEPVRLTDRGDIYTLLPTDSTLLAFASDGIYALPDTPSGGLRQLVQADWSAASYGLIVRQLRSGSLLIADEHAVYLYDGKAVRQVVADINLIRDMLVDRWDRLWVATYQGVYCFFNRGFTNHWLTDESDIARALAFDRSGRLTLGTLNGKVIQADGTSWNVCSDDPEQFYAPSSVRIGGSVYMAGNGDITCISDSDGTPRQHWLQLPSSRYQFVGEAWGRLITGNRNSIFAIDPGTSAVDTLTTEILHPWCCAHDAQGRLWIGSSSGLFSIDQARHVSKTEYDNQKLIITAMEADSHGNVFFASADSVFVVREGRVEALNPQIPLLSSHEVRALHISPRGFLVVAAVDGLFVSRISSDCRLSQVHYFDHHNGFTMTEPLKAAMAEDADGTVWMAGVEGLASFKPEELLAYNEADTIIPPPTRWWQRWWAVALMALAVLLLLSALIWLIIMRQHRRRLLRLQREKKLKELQINAIRLKTIPHFHSNVLAAIEYYLMNNSPQEASHYLKLYSDFTNQTLHDIDRTTRTVAEETEHIGTYLQLEQLRYGERLQYAINVADNVNRQALLPTMVLYTYCQNAVKHGIGNRPEGGHISIDITTDRDGQLAVSVADNGVGRKAAALLNTTSTKQGLRILMEQIELYNETNVQPISQTVDDLYDEAGKPAGTRYEMRIPRDYKW